MFVHYLHAHVCMPAGMCVCMYVRMHVCTLFAFTVKRLKPADVCVFKQVLPPWPSGLGRQGCLQW